MQKGVEVFCCYARKDQPLLLELKTHLTPLQREGLITLWADTDINAGIEWEEEIRRHLNSAQIILLLISPDFIASEYCYSVEMQRAIERHERGEAQVIPIILRPVDWQGMPFGKFQALPTNASPVTSGKWHHQDEAFYEVAKGIRDAVAERVRLAEEERVRKAAEAEQARLAEMERAKKIKESRSSKPVMSDRGQFDKFTEQSALHSASDTVPSQLPSRLKKKPLLALVGALLAIALSSALLYAGTTTLLPRNPPANQPQTKAHLTSTARSIRGHTTVPTLTPTQVPTQTPTPTQAPTQAPAPVTQPTQPVGNITVAFTNVPGQVNNNTTVQVIVQTQPGATVNFQVTYAGGTGTPVSMPQAADANGMATFNWTAMVQSSNNTATAQLTATATNNNGQTGQTTANVTVITNS